jgi:hypothetical protein
MRMTTRSARAVSATIWLVAGFAGGCAGRHPSADPCGYCSLEEMCGPDNQCHTKCNTALDCDTCQECASGLCTQLAEEACFARTCNAQSCTAGCCQRGVCNTPAPAFCGKQGQACVDCTAEPRADGCSVEKGCTCSAIADLCPQGEHCGPTGCSTSCLPRCEGKCRGPDTCGGSCPDNCISPETCDGGGVANACGCTPSCSGECGGTDGCGGTCANNCVPPETCGGGGVANVCGCTPRDGGWTAFGSWYDTSGWSACGSCSQSKTQRRDRTCTSPEPSCGGAVCSGSPYETSTATQGCDQSATWTSLGTCSASCDGGSTLQRCDTTCGATCGSYTNGQTAYNGPACNTQPCCSYSTKTGDDTDYPHGLTLDCDPGQGIKTFSCGCTVAGTVTDTCAIGASSCYCDCWEAGTPDDDYAYLTINCATPGC